MSASNPGPGRPPGISEATLEKQRRVREMDKLGVPRATIAAVEKCTPGYVGMLINGGAKEAGSPEPEIEPPQPRRLSRRAAQYRAWEIVQQRPAPGLGLDVSAFWIRLIVEIHESGDGFRLGIGEPASRFSTRSDLAVLFGRPDHLEIDAWLAALVDRGRLVDVGDVDIGIPHGMKLTAAENIRAKRTAKLAAQPFRDGQVPMLQALPGGLSGATEIPPETQIKYQLNLHPAATEIPLERKFNSNSIQPVADASAATAAAYVKENQPFSSSSSIDSRADAGEAAGNLICAAGGISFAPDANLIPPAGAAENPDASLINSKRSPLAVLAEELVALAKITRAPNADDLGAVKSWLDRGIAADTMRAVIENGMTRRNGRPPTALRYFESPMRTVNATPAPTPAPSIPQPALSAADQAIKDELVTLWQRAHTGRKSRLPPVFSAYQAAALNGHGPAANRWLTIYKGCLATDNLGGLPEFGAYMHAPAAYEATLLEIEEELTAPTPPQAAD